MQIFIQHQGQQTGPFSVDQVRAGISAGTYQLSDMAWHEGAAGWAPLATISSVAGDGPSFTVERKTSKLAITSLVLGVVSIFTLGLTGLPAVICGHIARWNVRRSGGASSGGGMALAGLICGYIGLSVILVSLLAGLVAPLVLRQRKKAEQTEAINNARSFSLALFEFKEEYGAYPGDETAATVAEYTETKKATGNSSNARFRQLVHSGIAPSERIFYAKASGVRRADDNVKGDNAVAKGECGFAYVDNLTAADETPRPIAMTPFVPGTDQFDPRPFAGKAVILWTDGSMNVLPIKSGKVMIDGKLKSGGKHLLDPSHPVWGGKPPVLALPE